ncbi:MAG: STAS domain-containing protein [Desulfuromonas sp.]|nr:STAS domain-containing protein [Desulfuromonas sp.]
MFEFESRQMESADGEQRLELVLSGDLSIVSVARLKELLLDCFSTNKHVVMDMGKVTSIDFSVMQLLCATNKYAQKTAKCFVLKHQCTEAFIDEAQSLGFLREQACNDAEDPLHCLWIPENLNS